MLGLALSAALFGGPLRAATDVYYVGRLDLFDAEHTSDEGYRVSRIFKVLPSGVVAGYSSRYPDVPYMPYAQYGESAWIANAWGRTVRVGFGGGLTSPQNVQSVILALNRGGTALGVTYLGSVPVAWIASIERGTTRLDHFSGNGSTVVDLNDGDWLIGYVDTVPGRTAYLAYRNATPIRIGLVDAAHTASDGRQMTLPAAINSAGFVLGNSVRYLPGTINSSGETAWVRDADGDYWVPAPEASSSRAHLLTESGYFGFHARFPDGQEGLYVGNTARSVRPIGAGTAFERLAENGAAVVSVSDSYRGSTTRRINWLNTATHGTVVLGLPDYLQADGLIGVDTVAGLTESGLVAGTTERNSGGAAGWVADFTGATTRIGLYDAEYQWSYNGRDGLHSTFVRGVTESGFVWGGSYRAYADPNQTSGGGVTGWVYHVATNATQTFAFPGNDRGYTFSRIDRVLENGTVTGTYRDFADNPEEGEERVFLWVPGEGLILLDERIDVPAGAAGFDYGYGPLRYAADAGLLVGFGPISLNPYIEQGGGVYAVKLDDGTQPPPPPRGEIGYVARLGFYDAAHTAVSGEQASDVLDLTASGYALGFSRRFVGADDVPAAAGRLARTAWLGDAVGVTRRVGFYDALHTRDDGRRETTPVAINEGGVTIGTSTRFDGHAYAGESAWVADRHGATLKLGYYDAAHTGAGGIKISRVVDLNKANQVIGYSLQPDTDAASAWLATSTGKITRIGLMDAAHTAPDGTRADVPVALNDSGYVVGLSEYHVPGVTASGWTPWLRFPDGSMRVVGLQTGVHRVANGLHHSSVDFLSANGRVVGHAHRYGIGQSVRVGQTAWLTPVASPNRPVGFYTGIHAGANNVAYSRVMGLNASGHAMGFSTQYPAGARAEGAGRGRTAWLASTEAGTVRVGLYDTEHSTGPFQFNHVRGQNDDNAVVGTAMRFAAGADRGLDGWYATIAGGTRRLMLDDARHQRSDGYARHVPTLITNSRRVAGISARYTGNLEVGQSAWIYDVATGDFNVVELSVRPSDQFAWSVVTDLREDGSAVGIYRKFAADGSSLGDRAFMYIPRVGAFDLGSVLEVTPESRGWAFLGRPEAAGVGGLIVGTGPLLEKLTPPFSYGVYLLRE